MIRSIRNASASGIGKARLACRASLAGVIGGTWLFDDETALAGLAAYKYLAGRIGDSAEAQWAATAYASLLSATNAGLAANENASGFDFLPCAVNQPVTADRCNSPSDANWASQALWGENPWDILLQGGALNGPLGDPGQTDNLYQMGFARLAGTGVPYPSFGAYTGYSVALNTGYAAAALYGDAYRDLPITSYAWQIATTTTGDPDAWWEANGSPPDPANPWQGSHAAPEFGAVPYAWPMAGQTQTLLQSLVASGRTPSGQAVLYLGRGAPDAWLTPGQSIRVDNLTASYNVRTTKRATYGVRIDTRADHGIEVTLAGRVPTRDVRVQLPAFASAGVRGVEGGRYDAATHTVLMDGRRALIRLGDSARPALSVSVASTVPGQHAQPMLTSGAATTATTTINLTPYWGDWPQTGTQWVELDWSSPVTTSGSDVYFADDGGGLRLPASWTVQYWNGSAFVDVPASGAYPSADNTFNHVSFGSITTTKLRVVMQSGLGSVGVIQWVVPSIPATQ